MVPAAAVGPLSVLQGQGRKANVTKRGANCQARRSPKHAGLHIEDAIAASRHHLAGGFRGKIDEMPRRLIAVIVVSSVSAAFGFDREGSAGLHA
jgi:hypothetical protein